MFIGIHLKIDRSCLSTRYLNNSGVETQIFFGDALPAQRIWVVAARSGPYCLVLNDAWNAKNLITKHATISKPFSPSEVPNSAPTNSYHIISFNIGLGHTKTCKQRGSGYGMEFGLNESITQLAHRNEKTHVLKLLLALEPKGGDAASTHRKCQIWI